MVGDSVSKPIQSAFGWPPVQADQESLSVCLMFPNFGLAGVKVPVCAGGAGGVGAGGTGGTAFVDGSFGDELDHDQVVGVR